jgi:hypothetical protein
LASISGYAKSGAEGRSKKLFGENMKNILTTIAILFSGLILCHAQTRTGLPLDLDYAMSKQQVVNHLKAMDVYRTQSSEPDTIDYVIPDHVTNTKNGLFLKFSEDKLVEIASMKSGMDGALYTTYLSKLLEQAQQWKAMGCETIIEDEGNAFYLYRNLTSYFSISGSKSRVTLTFMEKNFHEKVYSK